jgi:hypothetical protein
VEVDKTMKITLENYGLKIHAEFDHEDVGIDEMVEVLRGMLLSMTFHIDTINEYLPKPEEKE